MTKYINFTEEFEKDVQDELELKRKKNSGLTTRTYCSIIRTMMHGQLHDVARPDDKNKKGVVVTFACKSDMTKKLAKKIWTLQQLINDQPTHFSQGAYPSGLIKCDKKGTTWGFVKENLNQINFIFIDIDDQKRTPTEIVDWSHMNGLKVNLIVKTDKGYQVYFVLQEALYLNNKKKQWILNSADKTANTIKNMFKNGGFNVDTGCVNYQICRFPRRDFIVYYDIDNLNTYDYYAKWSLKHQNNNVSHNVVSGGGFTLVKGNLPGWCQALRGFSQYEEGDRNTCLYTVALGYKDSEIPLKQAIAELVPWMSGQGLKESDSKRTVESAYKGGKHATKQYFQELIEKYDLDTAHVATVDFKKMTEKERKRFFATRKPAKKREDRVRNHASEYADDLMKMIESEEGRLAGKKSELMKRLGLKRGNNKPLDNALEILRNRKGVTVKQEKQGRQIVITIEMINNIDLEGQQQTGLHSVKKSEKKMTKKELVKAVALSVVGPVSEREGYREKVVLTVGMKNYQSLLTAFITDPSGFMGGDDKLNEVRQTG